MQMLDEDSDDDILMKMINLIVTKNRIMITVRAEGNETTPGIL